MTAGSETTQTPLVRCPGISETPVEGDVFLAGPDGQRIYYLNEIAAGIWAVLESPHTREEIKSIFRDAFPDASSARIDADLDPVLDTLLAQGLIRPVD